MMRSLAVATLAVLSALISPAEAATLSVLDGTGASKTLGQGVDGASNLLGANVICGASATATLYAVCVNQVVVNASGQMLTLSTLAGTLPAFAATPAVNVATVPADGSVTATISALDTISAPASGWFGGEAPQTGAATACAVFSFASGPRQGLSVQAKGALASGQTLFSEQTIDAVTWQPALGSLINTPSGVNPLQANFPGPWNGVGFSLNIGTATQYRLCVRGTGSAPSIAIVVSSSLTNPNVVQATTGNVVQANSSLSINISTAVTTQLVAAVSGKAIDITAWDVISNGATTFTFEYGTGSLCATGTTPLSGPYGLVAQFGLAKGSGLGPVLLVPPGNALCAVNSSAVQVSGSMAFIQF